MPKPSKDLVTTTQDRRIFLQIGGPIPGNELKYAGQDTQYLMLDGVTRPIRGDITPIRVPNPKRTKSYLSVGRKASAPDLPSATLHVLENRSSLPFSLGALDCAMNIYLPVGKCADPSDFANGWNDLVEILSWAEATSVDEGKRTDWEADDQAEDAISLTLESKYAIAPLGFGVEAANDISREVMDIIYGSEAQCGDCGPADDGTQLIYAVTKSSGAGSPGLPAELVYSLNGGDSWSQVNIDGLGASEDPLAIELVGSKLMILSDSDAYYWATLNKVTGVPGTFTKVTLGIVAAGTPRDIYVLSAREVFLCGDGGYLYKSTDIAAGVTVVSPGDASSDDLLRIHGDGQNTIVAAGAGSSVVVSHNRGSTFAAVAAEPIAFSLDITALWVVTDLVWWVGTGNSGRMYYTLNGGASWILKAHAGEGVGYIRDIVFATDEVGYMAHDDNSPTGRLFATWNGGEDWFRDDSTERIRNWPVMDRITRIAVPQAAPQVAANNVAMGGLAGDGSDGILLIGKANET